MGMPKIILSWESKEVTFFGGLRRRPLFKRHLFYVEKAMSKTHMTKDGSQWDYYEIKGISQGASKGGGAKMAYLLDELDDLEEGRSGGGS